MTKPNDIDRFVVKWADRVFNSGPVPRSKGRRGLTGLRIVQSGGTEPSEGISSQANNVRSVLKGIAKRTPQVMLRISGGGKGISHINAHLSYISRNGRIPLEDQNGDRLVGKDSLHDLADEWQFGGFPMCERGDTKQAFNMVLSMPAGTDVIALHLAVRDFAGVAFSGFQYAMALHTQETDPDSDPSPHPHVHLCVKATGLDGTRLNPRKADLQLWRERFASCLQERGVDAAATKRIHRFQKQRGEKQAVHHIRARGDVLTALNSGTRSPERKRRAERLEMEMSKHYEELASALSKSPRTDDRLLAGGFASREDRGGPDLDRPAQATRDR